MPAFTHMDAPKAWAAICQLCGGEERIDPSSRLWGDNFIPNFGTEHLKGHVVEPRKLDNWHVDGDFFVHFLDSPEQALLVIPCVTDVLEGGGPTYICPDCIGVVAKHLFDHPEGVTPMTGNCGDVILMHPLMMHSASPKTPYTYPESSRILPSA